MVVGRADPVEGVLGIKAVADATLLLPSDLGGSQLCCWLRDRNRHQDIHPYTRVIPGLPAPALVLDPQLVYQEAGKGGCGDHHLPIT